MTDKARYFRKMSKPREVMIITMTGDIHAAAVAWSLGQKGHICNQWIPEIPPGQFSSARFSPGCPFELDLQGVDGSFSAASASTVWRRRVSNSKIPEHFPEGDRVVGKREMDGFLFGLIGVIGADALWANLPATCRVGALKLVQLHAAHRIGLRVPKTLVSNDVTQVGEFTRASRSEIIYKPFYPAVWQTEAGEAYAMTAFVDEGTLSDPESLRFCPGIFQEFIPKAYELRVTLFGRTCIAAKLVNQDRLDYRVDYTALGVEPYNLPESIKEKLFQLLNALNLVMGTVDMIVTPDGDYVFLEINEQGQFLWIEEANPEVSLLEPFSDFLASADPHFQWTSRPRQEYSFLRYLGSDNCRAFEAESKVLIEVNKDLLVTSFCIPDGK